ncbi:MAG: DUF4249 family protein [Bacteroidetes bacterium]|nr:DUF4249 family protein [Bacteroidota bacterium]
MKDKSKTILHHYSKTLLHILFCAVLASGFYACKTDFDVNEKWKEIDIVYGLLSSKDSFLNNNDYPYDSVQYVRVSKAFLNNNSSALDIAKNPDSLYHKDPINVVLDEYQIGNPTPSKSFTLEKDISIAKDSGLFAYPSQVLYRTPKGFKLNTQMEYKIRVNNPKTGVNVSAKTKVIAATKPGRTLQFRPVFFWSNDDTKDGITWKSAPNARFYDVSYVFHITEYNKQTKLPLKTFDLKWPLLTTQLTNSLDGNEDNSIYTSGKEFFNFVARSIPVNDNVIRRFTKKVDLWIEAGGDDIYYYIQVNQPSIGIVQKKPEYTNIENGYGIFSARASTLMSLPMSTETIDSLGTAKLTAKLNFVR